ncbi:MAG: hypothetical protein MOP51_849 [Citricoccus sp.]|nr:hypothetical protein [Citricoccus sp. WCRC_4]
MVPVIDGDTIDAKVGGRTERIRLLNVDTPETKHPQEPVQCLGPEATEYLESLLAPGDRIELEYDVERTDRYDRTLAGVVKDESLVNANIAEAGLGVAVLYEPNGRFYQQALDAQERAQEADKGLHDPEVGCTLLGLASAALPPLEDLPAEVPVDAAGVAAALPAAEKYRDRLEAKQVEIRQAEEARQAEEKRKAEEARKAEVARKAEAERNRPRQQPQQPQQQQRKPAAPRQQSPGGGYGTDADFPGYTGPRCYAPGGQVWRPCG